MNWPTTTWVIVNNVGNLERGLANYGLILNTVDLRGVETATFTLLNREEGKNSQIVMQLTQNLIDTN